MMSLLNTFAECINGWKFFVGSTAEPYPLPPSPRSSPLLRHSLLHLFHPHASPPLSPPNHPHQECASNPSHGAETAAAWTWPNSSRSIPATAASPPRRGRSSSAPCAEPRRGRSESGRRAGPGTVQGRKAGSAAVTSFDAGPRRDGPPALPRQQQQQQQRPGCLQQKNESVSLNPPPPGNRVRVCFFPLPTFFPHSSLHLPAPSPSFFANSRPTHAQTTPPDRPGTAARRRPSWAQQRKYAGGPAGPGREGGCGLNRWRGGGVKDLCSILSFFFFGSSFFFLWSGAWAGVDS